MTRDTTTFAPGVQRPERQWTKARKLALEAFFLHDGRARRSNTTDAMAGLAYWQSVDWMLTHGFVEPVHPVRIDGWRLTLAGWEAGRQLWNVPQRTLDRMMRKARAS